jgi:uncharacterized protein
MKKICTIYRSPKKEGMYLYVEKAEDLTRVPELLLQRFGKPEQAMTLLLHTGRKLARVDTDRVLEGLYEQGYFLQMPPGPEPSMQAIHELNTKIPK